MGVYKQAKGVSAVSGGVVCGDCGGEIYEEPWWEGYWQTVEVCGEP